MNKRLVILSALVFVLALAFVLLLVFRPETGEKRTANERVSDLGQEGEINLVYAAHWTEKFQTEGIYDENGNLVERGLRQYLDEYSSIHPEVTFDIMTISYGEYESKLRLLDDIDEVPDIFQIYSPWGVSYVKRNMVASVPEDIKNDIRENYFSTAGVTIDNDIWGVPGEINDFSLIYNKEIFKEAGIVDANGEARAPRTWSEFAEAARKTTKKDAAGNITQYGIAFTKGMDWAVVDPFLSLLFSNGGAYLSEDNSQAAFNSEEGVEVLNGIKELFDNGYTDESSNVWDFSEGKVAMAFIAPWTEGVFQEQMGERFNTEVGVAPVPYFEKPGSLQYSWFLGVMDKSRNKEAAWDFLRWFTRDIQEETGTTRYGDLMARTIKAIPSRVVDLENNSDVLEDNFFKAPFISQLPISTPEPNVLQAAEMKAILMKEIEATWSGKDAREALNDAAIEINFILKQNR